MVAERVPVYPAQWDETDRRVTPHAAAESSHVVRAEPTVRAGAVAVNVLAVARTPLMRATQVEMIRELLEVLAIDEAQAARMLGIRPDAVEGYLAGRATIPSSVQTRVEENHAALGRLLRIFRRDRLAEVLRRRAPSFGDQTALDIVLGGRIGEVADIYERALTYQA